MTGGAFEGTLAGFSLNLKPRPGRFSQSERGRRAEGRGRRAWLPILLPYQYENSWAVSAHWVVSVRVPTSVTPRRIEEPEESHCTSGMLSPRLHSEGHTLVSWIQLLRNRS